MLVWYLDWRTRKQGEAFRQDDSNAKELEYYVDSISKLLNHFDVQIAPKPTSDTIVHLSEMRHVESVKIRLGRIISGRTKIALRYLSRDTERKTGLMRFLVDSGCLKLFPVSLQGLDLAGLDLCKLDLSGADLKCIPLNGVNLYAVTWNKETKWPDTHLIEGAKNIPRNLRSHLRLS